MPEYIKSFAKDYINGNHKPEYEAEIKRVYYKLFRQRLSGCKTCMIEAIFKILNRKPMGKYRLKRGVQLQEHSNISTRLNWKTQTDELCEYWLKKDIHNARFFDELPENYMELIGKAAKKLPVKQPEKIVINENVDEILENGKAKPKKQRKNR